MWWVREWLYKQKQKEKEKEEEEICQYADFPFPTLYDFFPEHLKTGDSYSDSLELQTGDSISYPNWVELPRDVTASILSRLGPVEIIESAQKVCTQWRDICKNPLMWRSIDMRNLGESHVMPYDLDIMCMHAIDRSCGGLVDISIEFFGTDELLTYMAQRTSNLKRLRLVVCRRVSDEGLSEAASKFPLLEELEIYETNVRKDSIEAVGRCCPLLHTFKYNQRASPNSMFEYDDEALAIAKNMHGLRHLQLVGNELSNRGLQAILDGCPYLESLDLRNCFKVNLEGDLGKRCAEQIKNLKRPEDPIHDYQFADAEMNGHCGLPKYSYLYLPYFDEDQYSSCLYYESEVYSLFRYNRSRSGSSSGSGSDSDSDYYDDRDPFDFAYDDDAFDEYDIHPV
ncbi:hypothetical protein PTKIN_Ptkin10aG0195900 [Pterospermum kingtungense]